MNIPITLKDLQTKNLVRKTYKKGQEIVREGRFIEEEQQGLHYAQVPLGYILQGEVNVIKGAKATKQLCEGEFIGLFETSDWLLTKKNRHIGDWTLVAERDTEIAFFPEEVLRKETGEFLDYLIKLARTSTVPQPITHLPLLDWVASHTTKSRLTDCLIIAHTHLLPNNFPLFRHLAYLVGFGNMIILEKPYSTVRSTLHEAIKAGIEVVPVRMKPGIPYEFSVQESLGVLWQKGVEVVKKQGIKKILILDDGGDIWFSIPWEQLNGVAIAGAEQTQRGITRISNTDVKLPPVVSVASSAIKKNIEPEFIAHSIVKKLMALGVLPKKGNVGIIGLGSIGQAIKDSLERETFSVLAYDSSKASTRGSLDVLINDCDVIIGTTGTDALKGMALERIKGKRIFASASSADIEFSSLLRLAEPQEKPYQTIRIELHEECAIDILNGGFPINFDREKNATADEDIVLTRCLLYIGMMQAAQLLEKETLPGIYALDQESQERTLEKWLTGRGEDRCANLSLRCKDSECDMPTIWRN